MREKVEGNLRLIADMICEWITSRVERAPLGVYDGDFGILLFLYYYSSYTQDSKIVSITDSFSDKVLEDFSEGHTSYTFCSGLSGILYLFEFFKENEIVEFDFREFNSIFREIIISNTRNAITSNEYDFMHGALGAGLFFIKNRSEVEFLKELILFLDKTADKDDFNEIYKWKSKLGLDKTIGYNICLSHGISSIVLFLCRLIESEIINDDKIFTILTRAVNYLISQQIDIVKYGSFFPNQSKAEICKSRLAWCYGDLGVAYSIWKAGKSMNNYTWKKLGLDILLFAAKSRRTPYQELVNEASICHGSAGIALFFNHLFIEIGNESFKEAAEHWTSITLHLFKHDEKLINNYSLLTGITGIGMFYLSYLTQDAQSWDEILLL